MDTRKNEKGFIAFGLLLSAAIFISDWFTPLGIADGVSYIVVVLLTLWIDRKYLSYYTACFVSVLNLLGIFLSPRGESASIFLTNRALAFMGIWVSAFLIQKFKLAQAAAKRDEERLNALFEHATEGIILTDDTGSIIMANPEVEKQFAWRREELIGNKIEMLIPEKFAAKHIDHRKNFHENPHTRYMGKSLQLYAKRKDGTTFPVEVSLSSYRMEKRLYVIAFIIDITERKKQQDEISAAHSELQQYAHELKLMNAELENFAYISSHDLQEPLRKILSFGDRLKLHESEKLSTEGRDYLERMLNASVRMQRLINDLLAFSRLSSRAGAFVNVNLNTIVSEVLSDMEVSIENSQARIDVSPLPDIDADPTQMRQLFQNLIGNAIKFARENERPEITIRPVPIEVHSFPMSSAGKYIQFIVEDNGIGFDKKYLDRIFNIFQRLEGKKYEGSGIGLAICKKIVQRHGGDITADSIPGKGSRFIITLPVRQEA